MKQIELNFLFFMQVILTELIADVVEDKIRGIHASRIIP